MLPTLRARHVAAATSALALAAVASAQDYWPIERIEAELAREAASGDVPPQSLTTTQNFTHDDPDQQRLEEAQFIETLQAMTPGPNCGGMREAEHLLNIIQTDNTTESIWVWSWHRLLTGDTQFDQNTAKAWTYVMNFPAYLEEGGAGPNGYYRIYNCGWALIAEPIYRAATGDTQYLPYAETCANYVVNNPLSLGGALNTTVQAWAAGALYRFGLEQGNVGWQGAAVQYGDACRVVAEASPTILDDEPWAMSGGVILWGVLESYFQARPGGRAWANAYAPFTKVFDSSGTWAVGHSGWYALGNYAAWQATGNGTFLAAHRQAYEILIAVDDADDDGGIGATSYTATTQDESWVSNYLAFMGIEKKRRKLDAALGDDVAALSPGDAWDIGIGVGSHDALAPQMCAVDLELESPSGVKTTILSRLFVLQPNNVIGRPSFPVPLPANAQPGIWTLSLTVSQGMGPVDVATLEVDVQ